MNLTPRQREMVVLVANWLNRAIPESPLVVVPRWRLQELKHEDVDSDSLGRDFSRYKRLDLVVSLMLLLLPYRYRLLAELVQRRRRTATSTSQPHVQRQGPGSQSWS